MIHYHGTPISPNSVLRQLSGCHFCVSFVRPDNLKTCHEIGQSLMLDNGAFSAWRRGISPDWARYYAWVEKNCWPADWAVIPDVVDGGVEANDALLAQWPHGMRGAPVWHLDEPLERLCRLAGEWPRVCLGSSGQYARVGTESWKRRIDEAFGALCPGGRVPTQVHGLRMMACSGRHWPFASVDSTDVGRNHNRPQNDAISMARRWDAMQCPGFWQPA